MASGSLISWQTDGEEVEELTHFIFLDFKITAHSGCSHKIKRHLLLGRKATTNLAIKKQRHNFADKGPYGQGCGFPVVMYGCESRTIKKAEHKELMLLNCGTEEAS